MYGVLRTAINSDRFQKIQGSVDLGAALADAFPGRGAHVRSNVGEKARMAGMFHDPRAQQEYQAIPHDHSSDYGMGGAEAGWLCLDVAIDLSDRARPAGW
jgi:hypothetical protein